MAHKEIYKFSDLENKGWDAMHNILDKEMPNQKKKRKGIIYWWIGSAAAIVVLLIFALPRDNSRIAESLSTNKATSETPENTNQNEIAIISDNNQISKKEVDSDNSISNSTTTFLSSKKNNISKIAKIKNQENPYKNDSNIIHSDHSRNNINPRSTVNLNSPIVDKPIISIAKDEQVQELTNVPSIQNIDELAMNKLIINSELPNAPKVALNKKSKWSSYLNLGMIQSTNGIYNGINFGTNNSYQLNNRWKLNFGLSYLIRPNTYRNQTPKNLLQDASSSNTSAFDLSYVDDLPKRTLHNLRLQTAISYDLNHKLSTNIGLNLNYLTSSNEKLYDIYSSFNDPGSPSGVGLDQFRFAYGTSIGIAYKINDRLSLAGNYNYLLNDKERINQILPNFYTDEVTVSMQYMLD